MIEEWKLTWDVQIRTVPRQLPILLIHDDLILLLLLGLVVFLGHLLSLAQDHIRWHLLCLLLDFSLLLTHHVLLLWHVADGEWVIISLHGLVLSIFVDLKFLLLDNWFALLPEALCVYHALLLDRRLLQSRSEFESLWVL